jgi:hypothetical protein
MVLLQGPKGIGKEHVLTEICNELGKTYQIIDLSKRANRKIFEAVNEDLFSNPEFNAESLIFLEGQYLSNFSALLEFGLKDKIKQQITITFSFALNLEAKVLKALEENEYLHHIYPYSYFEISDEDPLGENQRFLEDRILYGSYPSVLGAKNPEIMLKSILDASLKSIFSKNERVNKLHLLRKVLQIVAIHVGNPLSYYEIGQLCHLDNETVERYIELMINAKLLIKLPCYYNEKRYELKKSYVFYFLDTGIRNMLINNFNPLEIRGDAENLWKNWLISEKIKWQQLNDLNTDLYFWQSHTSQKIDLLESNKNDIAAYKTSYSKKIIKAPPLFSKYYPAAPFETINLTNYWHFITKK